MDQIEKLILPCAEVIIKVEEPECVDRSVLNRIKMGDVYKIQNEQYSLVCVHCLAEFQYFSEFTLHVEEHLQKFVTNKEETANDENDTVSIAQHVKEEDEFNIIDIKTESLSVDGNMIDTMLECAETREEQKQENYIEMNLSNVHEIPINDEIQCDVFKRYKLEQGCGAFPMDVIDTPEARQLAKYSVHGYQFERSRDLPMCPLCKKTFSSTGIIRRHLVNTHMKEKVFICRLCELRFPTPLSIRNHLKENHKETGTIKKTTTTISAATKEKHIDSIDDNQEDDENNSSAFKRFKIEIGCDLLPMDIIDTPEARIIAKYSVRNYRFEQDGDKIKCPYCGKAVSSRTTVRRHIFVHMKQNIFQCRLCPQNFTTPQLIRAHLHYTHNEDLSVLTVNRFTNNYVQDDDDDGATFDVFDQYKTELGCYSFPMDVIDTPESRKLAKYSVYDHKFERENNLPVCPYCKVYSIADLKSLRTHMLSHLTTKLFQCTLCSETFRQPRKLKDHIKFVHKCETIVRKKSKNGRMHKKDKSKMNRLTRDTGDEEFEKYKTELANRFSTLLSLISTPQSHSLARFLVRDYCFEKTDDHLFLCPVCTETEKLFATKSDVRRHILKHSTENMFRCTLCLKTFTHPRKIHSHLRKQHAESSKSYECYLCRKSFLFYGELKQHMNSHSNKHINCILCDSTFDNYPDYHRHMIKLHPNDTKLITGHQLKVPNQYECYLCRRNFHQKRKRLVEHFYLTHKQRDVLCPTCGGEFRRRNFKKHSILCTGAEKTLECGVCNRQFHFRRYLTGHYQRIHGLKNPTQEVIEQARLTYSPLDRIKSKTCTECGKLCVSYCRLKQHMRVHNKIELQLPCNICVRVFKHKFALTNHMRSHNKKK